MRLRRPAQQDSTTQVLGWDHETYVRCLTRVSKMATADLFAWVDAAGSEVARTFQDYRKNGDLASLDEIDLAIITMWAITQELRLRSHAQVDPTSYHV